VQLTPNDKKGLLLAFCVSVIVVLALVALACPSAHGQEVIMNQPSADIVDKGHLFARSDSFYTQSDVPGAEHLWGTANFAYGLGHNFEVSLNGSDIYHAADTWQIVPGFKYAPIKTKNFEIYVGDQYYKPVSNISTFHNGNITYEAAAVKVGDFRFTGGSFQSVNAVAVGNRTGAIGGVEYNFKPMYHGWMFGTGVDYASGAGTNGYTSPGVMFSKKNFFISPGYMIANPHNPNGAHQTFLMIGDTF
jgi:hypothetical protein